MAIPRILIVVLCLASLAVPATPAGAAVAFQPPETIVFSRTDASGTHLFSIKPDGSGETQLTFGPDVDTQPAWSPDGTRILFTRRVVGARAAIYSIDADGSNVHPVLASARAADWNQDGSAFAFVRTQQGDADIWKADADGSNAVQVTSGPARDRQPEWSVGSTWFSGAIAFTRRESVRRQIYFSYGLSSPAYRVTNLSADQRSSVWLGDTVYLLGDATGSWDLWKIDIVTQTATDVGGGTSSGDLDVNAIEQAVFTRADGGGDTHLWLADVSNGAVVPGPVTTTPGVKDRGPNWIPSAAWDAAYDDQTKGNLLEATAAARSIFDADGSFQNATASGLKLADPTLDFVARDVGSTAPDVISAGPYDADVWGAAALSPTGICFYIQVDALRGLTYASYGGGGPCVGVDAIGAANAGW